MGFIACILRNFGFYEFFKYLLKTGLILSQAATFSLRHINPSNT